MNRALFLMSLLMTSDVSPDDQVWRCRRHVRGSTQTGRRLHVLRPTKLLLPVQGFLGCSRRRFYRRTARFLRHLLAAGSEGRLQALTRRPKGCYPGQDCPSRCASSTSPSKNRAVVPLSSSCCPNPYLHLEVHHGTHTERLRRKPLLSRSRASVEKASPRSSASSAACALLTATRSCSRSWVATTSVLVGRGSAFKRCCLTSKTYDGVNRHYYLRED